MTLKETFKTPIWKDNNLTPTGIAVSTGVGAATGFIGHKIRYGLTESIAKESLKISKYEYVKKTIEKSTDMLRSSSFGSKEAIEETIKNNMEALTKNAGEVYERLTKEALELLKKTKISKIKFLAVGALLGVGIYKMSKDIPHKQTEK